MKKLFILPMLILLLSGCSNSSSKFSSVSEVNQYIDKPYNEIPNYILREMDVSTQYKKMAEHFDWNDSTLYIKGARYDTIYNSNGKMLKRELVDDNFKITLTSNSMDLYLPYKSDAEVHFKLKEQVYDESSKTFKDFFYPKMKYNKKKGCYSLEKSKVPAITKENIEMILISYEPTKYYGSDHQIKCNNYRFILNETHKLFFNGEYHIIVEQNQLTTLARWYTGDYSIKNPYIN